MTPFYLLKALKTELEGVFADYPLPSKDNPAVAIKFFLQNLPAPTSTPDSRNFPFIVVRYAQTEDKDHETATAVIVFLIGCYDSGSEFQGYQDVMSIQERIRQHFSRNRTVANRYTADYPIKCIANDDFNDSTYPYFYGSVETTWLMPLMIEDGENWADQSQ